MLKLSRSASQAQRLSFRPCSSRTAIGLGGQSPASGWIEGRRRLFASATRRQLEAAIAPQPSPDNYDVLSRYVRQEHQQTRRLPANCPGCGAPSQTIDAGSAGFYSQGRGTVRDYMKGDKQTEDEVFQAALRDGALGNATPTLEPEPPGSNISTPICDRCHNLLHHSTGTSILHPSMHSIQSIIEESPHKHNHIYHILDAADFPLSLIPNLQSALRLPRLRTQNRRSKSLHYVRGRVAEVSFIITRSDLLAPNKEQVDGLMPYLREVLRDALGRSGRDVRLGNVRCVSARRGWWTKDVKERIWERGGAGWMVGKVNVGKSALFEVVFPKGRKQELDVGRLRREARQEASMGLPLLEDKADMHKELLSMAEEHASSADSFAELNGSHASVSSPQRDVESFQETELQLNDQDSENEEYDATLEDSLLPPAQKETAYPSMPLVSSLPGTTASPIRIPFGNGRGELIDLPGIQRSSLSTFVADEHKADLVMKQRVVPEQHTIKPGQSLLLGGMLRITPKTEDLIFLAYPFVPAAMKPHVTSTAKAVAVQTGVWAETGEVYAGTVESVATDEAKKRIRSAGCFKLEWNVTKRRSGPLTAAAAGKQKADTLPFLIYSADVLVEGLGWVELVAQVRSRAQVRSTQVRSKQVPGKGESLLSDEALSSLEGLSQEPSVPEVEVFSPEGKFVGVRRPMNAWLLGGKQKPAAHVRRPRPRQTVSFQKRKAGGAGRDG